MQTIRFYFILTKSLTFCIKALLQVHDNTLCSLQRNQVIFISSHQNLSYLLVMASKTQGQVKTKVKDPVSEMKIFRQGVKKEKICEKIYDDFKINQPEKLQSYTPKVNNNPFLLMKYRNQGRQINGIQIDQKLNDGIQKSQLDQTIQSKLKTVTHVPKQKWNIPQTANQEIGWYVDKGSQDSKFIYKRAGCPETHYADNYYTMRHQSLFSNGKQIQTKK